MGRLFLIVVEYNEDRKANVDMIGLGGMHLVGCIGVSVRNITVDELKKIFRRLKNGKLADIKLMHAERVKECGEFGLWLF